MVDETPLIRGDDEKQKKQGHRVFCCCDSRKATIIIALVMLINVIYALVRMAMAGNADAISIALYSVSILFYVLVVWGAIGFRRCFVMLALIGQVAWLVLTIVGMAMQDWSQVTDANRMVIISVLASLIVGYLISIYAFGTFLREVNNGTMSPETHGREKYSCCCNV